MSDQSTKKTSESASRGRKRDAEHACHLCGRIRLAFRRCRHCGFEMCQECTDENLWGITCNHITWVCPDCGESNSF